jgi:hypothetical protein
VARFAIEQGTADAFARGERVRFLTLTTVEGTTVCDLAAAFNRLRTYLKQTGELREYFAVIERTAGEAAAPPLLHLHLLATGRYIRQERLSRLWEQAAGARVVDVRAVRGSGPRSAGGYLVKQLARYAMKAQIEQLAAATSTRRVRPVRTSRGWYPGGMKAAARALAAERTAGAPLRPDDPGPWLFVVRRPNGSLRVRNAAACLDVTTLPQPEPSVGAGPQLSADAKSSAAAAA